MYWWYKRNIDERPISDYDKKHDKDFYNDFCLESITIFKIVAPQT